MNYLFVIPAQAGIQGDCLTAKAPRRQGDFRVPAPAALIMSRGSIAAGALNQALSWRLGVLAVNPSSLHDELPRGCP